MKIVFMGTPPAAVKSLEKLLRDGYEIAAVYTQPDRPSGRGNKLTAPPVKEFAEENNLPVFQPAKIKTPKALGEFRAHGADVAVVVAYGRILPEGFLNAFPHGAINVHFSLLPKYRGAAPVNWAIVNGETITGVTTMKMDAGLDTGDILLQRESPIEAEETAIELMDKLGDIGAELLSETLSRIDQLTPIPQDHSQATLAPILKKADGLIDLSMTPLEINNRIRGFQPFPTAFTFHKGKRLIFWKAHVVNLHGEHPDKMIAAATGELILAVGGGAILVADEVQLEGKKRMTVRDLQNSVKIRPDELG